jgi:hypothetical protein
MPYNWKICTAFKQIKANLIKIVIQKKCNVSHLKNNKKWLAIFELKREQGQDGSELV